MPAAPFDGLCNALDADPAHTCTSAAFPTDTHCSIYMKDINSICVDWFRSL